MSSWDGLGVETEGHRMSALARVCDTFAEHVQGLGRTSLSGIAAIWKIHSFSTVAPRTPVSISHLSNCLLYTSPSPRD